MSVLLQFRTQFYLFTCQSLFYGHLVFKCFKYIISTPLAASIGIVRKMLSKSSFKRLPLFNKQLVQSQTQTIDLTNVVTSWTIKLLKHITIPLGATSGAENDLLYLLISNPACMRFPAKVWNMIILE